MTVESDILRQRTIKNKVSISGIGLFTGKNVSLVFKQAPEDHGIVFERIDLEEKPKIFANLEYVKETPRCTILGKNDVSILTVEHLLSALSAFGIDNLSIEIDGPEIPVGDGSSKLFVDLIEKAGILEQEKEKKVIRIKEPISWSKDEVHIVALPCLEYKISYLLHYPSSEFLKSQYYSLSVNENSYKYQISQSRTFSIYEEIEPLLKQGFIKGGGLNNAVIIKDNKILNPDGVRFSEEMARHKILDLIGDLSLTGGKILAHIIAIRSGHFSNVAFAKKLLKKMG